MLPILKPFDYQKNNFLQYSERLFDNENAPLIVFGADRGISVAYTGASSEEELKENLPGIKQEALNNLKDIDIPYSVENVDGDKIVFMEGNEYASEKILDVTLMKELADKIGSNKLIVGIPFKGVLMATSFNANIRFKFPAIVQKYYNDSPTYPISDAVFIVMDGEVIGMGSQNMGEDNKPSQLSIIEDNDYNYTVTIRSSTIEELVSEINLVFPQIALTIFENKQFGGTIKFQLTDNIPLDQPLIDKCHSIIEQTQTNEMLQTLSQAFTKENIQFLFYHNTTLIAPQTNSGETQIAEEEKEIDYTSYSLAQLDAAFYKIAQIPNARTNVKALTSMSQLLREYKTRQIAPPTERKRWWQFWK